MIFFHNQPCCSSIASTHHYLTSLNQMHAPSSFSAWAPTFSTRKTPSAITSASAAAAFLNYEKSIFLATHTFAFKTSLASSQRTTFTTRLRLGIPVAREMRFHTLPDCLPDWGMLSYARKNKRAYCVPSLSFQGEENLKTYSTACIWNAVRTSLVHCRRCAVYCRVAIHFSFHRRCDFSRFTLYSRWWL